MRRGSLIYKDTELRQADPPSDGGVDISADAAAISRGSDGLSIAERPSVWELLASTTDELAGCSQMTDLLHRLENDTRFRRSQVAGSLAVIREVLREMSWQADPSDEVSLQVGTVAVIADLLLRHQP